MWFFSLVDNYNWARNFRELFEEALDAYRKGQHNADGMFTATHQKLIGEIGATPQEIFDLVEDTYLAGEPGVETALLVTAVRRDYFLYIQNGQRSERVIDMDELPGKNEKLGGIEWLPRIIEKARAKLRGEMPADLMYCCGGDRAFLREQGIHPADFLREIWAAGGNRPRILEFVIKSAVGRPADVPATACQILPGGRIKC